MADISRREMLLRAGAFGCSAAASPLFTPVALASAPGENRLVVIILRGAMDGLHVVQPYGDAGLSAARPEFETGPEHGAIDLDGFFALHPALSSLMPLWQAEELGFAHAVSTPYRDARSHFDGQDLLEAGTLHDAQSNVHEEGWLNRLLQVLPGSEGRIALALGRDQSLILSGAAPSVAWAPSTRLPLSQATSNLLSRLYHDAPLFQEAFETATILRNPPARGSAA